MNIYLLLAEQTTGSPVYPQPNMQVESQGIQDIQVSYGKLLERNLNSQLRVSRPPLYE